jgi:hypothetical protein
LFSSIETKQPALEAKFSPPSIAQREEKHELNSDMILYDIFVKLQLGCHPVAVVQYTFTQKQYTEGNKTNNT